MEKKLSKREWNKTQKRAALLEAAEKLFLQKGFDNTSIEDVASTAKLTKRTLYQYFLSKEDLYFAVALKGARMLFNAFNEGLNQGATAMEKIRLANKVHLQFYRENIGLFRILNYKPSNRENSAASPSFRELATLDGVRMQSYMRLVEEGRADGSINPGIDTRKAVFFAVFSAFSLLYTVAMTDKDIWTALEMDENDFLGFSFDMIADALK